MKVERNARAEATVEEEAATVEVVAEDMGAEAEEAMAAEAGMAAEEAMAAEAGMAAEEDTVAAERGTLSGIGVPSLSRKAKKSK